MYNTVLKCIFQIHFINLCLTTAQSINYTTPHLNMENWTSCEEFLANTTFDRSKVIDVDWKIFYFWNFEKENTYHVKFRVPSRLLTDRFRVELDKDLSPPVNWTEADLFMETSIDFSALFIRTEVPGKFRLIPSLAFQGILYSVDMIKFLEVKCPEAKSVPLFIFALKFVEPYYLGIMNCKYRLCYALAPVDRMPKAKDLKVEAERIGFFSQHGRSYLVPPEPRPSLASFSRDDADDDQDLDIEEHGFQGSYAEPSRTNENDED